MERLIAQEPYFARVSPPGALYLADTFELLEQLAGRAEPASSPIRMIFADPPYNLSNGGFTCHAGRAVSVDKGPWDKSNGLEADYDFHRRWLEKCQAVLHRDGTLWVTGSYHVIHLVAFAAASLGYKTLNEIAWFKPNASPNLSCRYFTASHETVLWLAPSTKSKHTFHYDLMRAQNGGKQMRSLWTIPTPGPSEKRHGKHPTQKPVALLRRIIDAATSPGELVLDPFCGSATTGVACMELARKFIGIDSCEEYLSLAAKRLQDVMPVVEVASMT